MSDEFIDYGELIDEAMHIIVRKALQIVQEKGLQGDHHFFISFTTRFPGVELSEKLLNKYEDEMTIVLQYQFEDLNVFDDGFSITLSFGGVKEQITIPFAALTAFADPSVKFGLQFRSLDEMDFDDAEEEISAEVKEFVVPPADEPDKKKSRKSKGEKSKQKDKKKSSDNVVTLDSFRKK